MCPASSTVDALPAFPVQNPAEIRVTVLEENEILRRGLVASLAEDRSLAVSSAVADEVALAQTDVAVVSGRAAESGHFPCPIVVCHDESNGAGVRTNGNNVVALLHRGTLTGAQLRATVHAAAAGLVVMTGPETNGATEQLDPRSKLVLEMLAEGHSTREIAERMSYSERTIKKLITGLHDRFDARTRAQIVAAAIRAGLI
jgi:DNA-binding CsgD family transcriptional regulator